eukprot:1161171-Pelagomonas_calceolata.AAC.4
MVGAAVLIQDALHSFRTLCTHSGHSAIITGHSLLIITQQRTRGPRLAGMSSRSCQVTEFSLECPAC